MVKYHHRKLPEFSTLLSGNTPPDEVGFRSDKLQIWYNNTEGTWADPAAHYHRESDEVFIVLRGSILVEVDGGDLWWVSVSSAASPRESSTRSVGLKPAQGQLRHGWSYIQLPVT